MIEPRSDRVPATQTKHHCYQVTRTTRVHQSSRSSRMVTVQEKVIRSRLQLGYSTPTNFINRYLPLFHSSAIRKPIFRVQSNSPDRHSSRCPCKSSSTARGTLEIRMPRERTDFPSRSQLRRSGTRTTRVPVPRNFRGNSFRLFYGNFSAGGTPSWP